MDHMWYTIYNKYCIYCSRSTFTTCKRSTVRHSYFTVLPGDSAARRWRWRQPAPTHGTPWSSARQPWWGGEATRPGEAPQPSGLPRKTWAGLSLQPSVPTKGRLPALQRKQSGGSEWEVRVPWTGRKMSYGAGWKLAFQRQMRSARMRSDSFTTFLPQSTVRFPSIHVSSNIRRKHISCSSHTWCNIRQCATSTLVYFPSALKHPWRLFLCVMCTLRVISNSNTSLHFVKPVQCYHMLFISSRSGNLF